MRWSKLKMGVIRETSKSVSLIRRSLSKGYILFSPKLIHFGIWRGFVLLGALSVKFTSIVWIGLEFKGQTVLSVPSEIIPEFKSVTEGSLSGILVKLCHQRILRKIWPKKTECLEKRNKISRIKETIFVVSSMNFYPLIKLFWVKSDDF